MVDQFKDLQTKYDNLKLELVESQHLKSDITDDFKRIKSNLLDQEKSMSNFSLENEKLKSELIRRKDETNCAKSEMHD
jgi:predicted nuclease with TOPRIM domain